MKVTIELEKIELQVLEREYKRLGLDTFHVGNNPTPQAMVIKKVVDAAKGQKK